VVNTIGSKGVTMMSTDPSISVEPSPGQTIPQDPLTFLRWLYGDDAPGWLTISTFDSQPTQWFPAHQLDQVATYCQAIARRYNCYFGLGLREEQLADGRGESADVLGIPCFWIELDIKHPVHTKANLPETLDQAIALVEEAIPLKPSVIIDSGYGGHFHWLLRELWCFEDDRDRQAAYHLLHRLQATIQAVAKRHGWDVDSTFDLARVLRVPGTYNRNVPDAPKPVRIIEADPDRRYNPSDFQQHLIDVEELSYHRTTYETFDGALPPIELASLKIPTWLKTLIRYGEDVNSAKPYPSRSEALFDAVQGLLKAGVDDQIIMSVSLDSRHAISEKPREKGRAWLASEITRARAKLDGHRPTDTSAREPETSEASDIGDDESQRSEPPIKLPWSDQSNAEILVQWYGQHMHCCDAWDCWLTWDRGRWKVDDTGRVMRFAKRTIKRLLGQLDTMKGEAEKKALLTHIKRSLSMHSLEAMVKSARSEPGIAVTPEMFDQDPWLFNVKNGTLDLRTGELRRHQRNDLLTKMSPVVYDEYAECPLWMKFLGEIYAGDQELITFIQKATGYTLTGITREQVLFICHGTGTNGKSTQIRVMSALMGEGQYALKTNLRAFTEATSQRQPTSIEYYIAKLHNVRLAYASEGEEGAKFSEGLIKDVTGGEPITGRHPYGRPFTFQPLFKLWFGTNHEPTISGTDPAIWRRPRKIPYTVNFEDRKDETLFDKLAQELPGILRWAVKGCLLWQINGLEPPKAVKDATTAYRRAMDIVGRFIEERCILAPYAKVESTTLYQAYVKWCDDNGETALSQRKLAGQLHERGLKNDTKNDVTRRIQWTGIDLEK
jgi:P4 family phage/plasmid primase-like protien